VSDSEASKGGAKAEGPATRNLAYEQARLAYSIIQSLLEHTRVTQDLVALMAQVIDEETQKALTDTPYWAAYLDSRRALERTREEIGRFTEEWTRLAEEAGQGGAREGEAREGEARDPEEAPPPR
jgi:hypothetical protein